MLLVLGSTMGQQIEKRKNLYQKVDQDIPSEVLAAIEKDIPGFHVEKEPVLASSKKNENKMLPLQKAELRKTYVVLTKERSLTTKKSSKKRAYYNAQGICISSSEISRDIALPRIILNTMGREYDGWTLVSNKVTIHEKGALRTVLYELQLKNGKDKERILLNEQGQLVKNRKLQIEDTLKARRQHGNGRSINIGSL